MKKVLMILGVVLLGLTSCKKEKIEVQEQRTNYEMSIFIAGTWGPYVDNTATFKINSTYLDYNDYIGTQVWEEVPIFGEIPYYNIYSGDTLKYQSNSGIKNTLIIFINNTDTISFGGMYSEFEYIVP